MEYFSDREAEPRPRMLEAITEGAWAGLVGLIRQRVADGSFGLAFPDECQDRGPTVGTDWHMMQLALRGDLPDIELPLDPHTPPDTLSALDLLEFCYRHVAHAEEAGTHSYYRHAHLRFDQAKGRVEFRQRVNTIFARHGIAFNITSAGRVERLVNKPLQQALGARGTTGDDKLNDLLAAAETKFLSPDPSTRLEALDSLWDAWERLKTVLPGSKKTSSRALLDRLASEPEFRALLETEARELTRTGNTFNIRHSETSQIPLDRPEHADYLFHRLYSFIDLALRSLPPDTE
ncbi:MAG: hypothetical protein WEE36_02445 [Acidimicrobiia bacterium]